MQCPKCRTETLERVPRRAGSTLRRADLPFRCATCEGLWVDMEDVPRLLRDPDVVEPAAESDVVLEVPETDRRAGLCPNGHGLLGRVRVEVDGGFFLDRCLKCEGLWFDRGEWQRLASRELLHRIPDFWTAAWQRLQRQKRQRQDYLEWIRRELGEELVDRLDELAERLRGHPQKSAAVTYLLQESRLPGRGDEAAE